MAYDPISPGETWQEALRQTVEKHRVNIQMHLGYDGTFRPCVWSDGEHACVSLFLFVLNRDTKRYEDASSHFMMDGKTEALHLLGDQRSKMGIRLNNQRHPRTLRQLDLALGHYYGREEDQAA